MVKSLKDGNWLSDRHIELAQELLRNKFSHIDGLQSPLLAQNNGFIAVQAEGNHKFVHLL